VVHLEHEEVVKFEMRCLLSALRSPKGLHRKESPSAAFPFPNKKIARNMIATTNSCNSIATLAIPHNFRISDLHPKLITAF